MKRRFTVAVPDADEVERLRALLRGETPALPRPQSAATVEAQSKGKVGGMLLMLKALQEVARNGLNFAHAECLQRGISSRCSILENGPHRLFRTDRKAAFGEKCSDDLGNISACRSLDIFMIRMGIGNGGEVILGPMVLNLIDILGPESHAFPDKHLSAEFLGLSNGAVMLENAHFVHRAIDGQASGFFALPGKEQAGLASCGLGEHRVAQPLEEGRLEACD